MKKYILILFMLFSITAKSQKIDSIYFNLYTDSLKKGVYNYINVDGKRSNGTFSPLMSDEVTFSSSAGKWDGNSLVIDSAFNHDSVVITVSLKERPQVKKSITIHIKKLPDPPLKTEEQLQNEWRRKKN